MGIADATQRSELPVSMRVENSTPPREMLQEYWISKVSDRTSEPLMVALFRSEEDGGG